MKSFLFLCLPTVCSFALFNGNPELTTLVGEGILFAKDSDLKMDVGYQKDWVFDYKLEADTLVDSSFSRSSSITDQAYLEASWVDRYQIYATLGSAIFEFSQDLRSDEVVNYTTKDAFTFGFGGKVMLYQGFGFTVGIDGKYQYACPDIPTVVKQGEFIPRRRNPEVSIYAWQLGASLAYKLDLISPYIGINYLNQKAHFQRLNRGIVSNLDDDFYAKNRIPVGGFLGFSITAGKDFSVTVESRFLSENALTLFLDLKF